MWSTLHTACCIPYSIKLGLFNKPAARVLIHVINNWSSIAMGIALEHHEFLYDTYAKY